MPLHTVDGYLQQGVRNAGAQLPVPPTRPAIVAMLAQRDWWLSADIDVMEKFIGSTAGYPDRTVLLHDSDRGEFTTWPHVSGIVVLDYRRSTETFDYGCVVLPNPWATHQLSPDWFPHARYLSCVDGAFSWLRGKPDASVFPTGTRCFAGSVDDALRLHGTRWKP